MKKGFKIAGIALGALLLLGVIAALAISRYGPSLLLGYLKDKVEADTNGRYKLSLDSLDFSPWTLSAHMGGLSLERDTTVQALSGIRLLDQFDVAYTQRSFDIQAFHLLRYVFSHTLEVEAMRLVDPSVKLVKNRLYGADGSDRPGSSVESPGNDSLLADTLVRRELAESGSQFFPILELGELAIEKGHFALYDGLKPDPVQQVKGLNLRLKKVRSDEDAPFSADSLMIGVDTATTLLERNFARLDLFDLYISPDSFRLDSLHLRHVVPPGRLNRLKGFRSFWVSAKARGLELHGVHYDRLIADSALVIDRVSVGNADITLFRDRADPRIDTAYKPLPPEIIRNFPGPLEIDTLDVLQADLALRMQAPGAIAPGQIAVNDMRITVTNVCNLPEKLEEDPYMDIAMQGKLMRSAPMTVDYRFLLTSPEDRYWANFQMRDLDATLLNDMVGSQAFITFRSGVIDNMALVYAGNNKANVGEMDFEYHDLKVRKLEEYDKFVPDNPHTGFLATLGNMLMPPNRNHDRKGYKKGVAYYEKEYNWGLAYNTAQTVNAGLRSSLGMGPRNLEKMQARAAALTDEDVRKSAEEAVRQLDMARQKMDKQARGAQ